MSALISLKASSTTQDVNVNVKPVTNVNIHPTVREVEEGVTVVDNGKEQRVVYGDDNPYTNIEGETTITPEKYRELENMNEVLKIIISMMQNNPFIFNGFIIADDEVLGRFVQLLTGADDVRIDAEDIGAGCITKNKYRKVDAIYVTKGTEVMNLMYDFPKVTKELNDLHVSTKFVW